MTVEWQEMLIRFGIFLDGQKKQMKIMNKGTLLLDCTFIYLGHGTSLTTQRVNTNNEVVEIAPL